MNRQTWIYILMVIAGLGLLMWILAIGTALVAPMNVSGDWVLDMNSDFSSEQRIHVEQSGRFARIIAGDAAVDVRRVSEARAHNSNQADVIRFEAARGTVEFRQFLNKVRLISTLPELPGTFNASRPVETPAERVGHAQ